MSAPQIQYPLLIIDTASRQTWVGLKTGPATLEARSEAQDPSASLFRLVESLLEATRLELEAVQQIAYCAGPGSMLGARTTSMAIRTWAAIGIPGAKRLLEYNSLALGACLAADDDALPASGLVVSDARRSSWNALAFPHAGDAKLELIANTELETRSEALCSFHEFPAWTESAAQLDLIHYDPSMVFADDRHFAAVMREVESAAPLVLRHNTFAKWNGKIHQAPAS